MTDKFIDRQPLKPEEVKVPFATLISGLTRDLLYHRSSLSDSEALDELRYLAGLICNEYSAMTLFSIERGAEKSSDIVADSLKAMGCEIDIKTDLTSVYPPDWHAAYDIAGKALGDIALSDPDKDIRREACTYLHVSLNRLGPVSNDTLLSLFRSAIKNQALLAENELAKFINVVSGELVWRKESQARLGIIQGAPLSLYELNPECRPPDQVRIMSPEQREELVDLLLKASEFSGLTAISVKHLITIDPKNAVQYAKLYLESAEQDIQVSKDIYRCLAGSGNNKAIQFLISSVNSEDLKDSDPFYSYLPANADDIREILAFIGSDAGKSIHKQSAAKQLRINIGNACDRNIGEFFVHRGGVIEGLIPIPVSEKRNRNKRENFLEASEALRNLDTLPINKDLSMLCGYSFGLSGKFPSFIGKDNNVAELKSFLTGFAEAFRFSEATLNSEEVQLLLDVPEALGHEITELLIEYDRDSTIVALFLGLEECDRNPPGHFSFESILRRHVRCMDEAAILQVSELTSKEKSSLLSSAVLNQDYPVLTDESQDYLRKSLEINEANYFVCLALLKIGSRENLEAVKNHFEKNAKALTHESCENLILRMLPSMGAAEIKWLRDHIHLSNSPAAILALSQLCVNSNLSENARKVALEFLDEYGSDKISEVFNRWIQQDPIMARTTEAVANLSLAMLLSHQQLISFPDSSLNEKIYRRAAELLPLTIKEFEAFPVLKNLAEMAEGTDF